MRDQLTLIKMIGLTILLVISIVIYIKSSNSHSFHDHTSQLSVKEKKELYIQSTKEWSRINDNIFKKTRIFLKVPEVSKNQYYQFMHSTEENGLLYPLRDIHNSELEYIHKVSYFTTSLPYDMIPSNLMWIDFEISTSTLGKKIQYRIPIQQTFILSAQDLGCVNCLLKSNSYNKKSTTSESKCQYTQECSICTDTYKGIYENGKCRTTAFIKNICFRVKEDNADIILDSTNNLFNNNENQPGCAFASNNYTYPIPQWSPFIYSPYIPSFVNVTLRHYKDPFITASNITTGCSTMESNLNKTDCLGDQYDDIYHNFFYSFFLVFAFFSYIIILIACIIYQYLKYTNSSLLKIRSKKFY